MLQVESPIVPKDSISGRALVAVVAIMTFLASLTTGAVMLVRATASDWQSDVSREVTVQVRTLPGRDSEADVARAAQIVRGFPGIAEARVFSKDESAKLLEPWLGSNLALDELPVPRMIVVKIASGGAVDFADLRRLLHERVEGASLDDHRSWAERMRAMAGSVVAGGVVILVLMFAATILSVTFATRGAMAANRTVIEVLHFIGARPDFIARHFQRRFLVLGLKGGLLGAVGAVVLFLVVDLAARWLPGSAAVAQFAALFGGASIGIAGYALVLLQAPVVAVVTALASRITVNRTLDTIQ
jgi:cell division transport system permease protein